MSMTREEAIELLRDTPIDIRSTREDDIYTLYATAKMMAIDALRHVSREQVEKVWSGCEYCTGDVDDRPYLDSKRLYLDKNGILTDEIENIDILRLSFCPVCGKPLTNEAVEMVMERINKMEGMKK